MIPDSLGSAGWLTAAMPTSRKLRLSLAGLCCAAAVLLALPASADQLQDCIDQGNAQGIDMPTCVEQDGKLVPEDSGNDSLGGGDGIPGGFVFLFVLVGALGVGLTIWKVSAARRLATSAGMDPDVATGVTLLDENGLSATYLASSLRSRQSPGETPTSPSPTAARLAELKKLLDGDLITQTEYDERRKAIIDSV